MCCVYRLNFLSQLNVASIALQNPFSMLCAWHLIRCLPFIFILSSLSPFCRPSCALSPLFCMKTHHSLVHALLPSSTTSRRLPPSLLPSLTHPPTVRALAHTHTLTVQPLRVVTEDTCLFHYLVPAPMSPSNKSVGSDAGSQDSVDGNTGPRSVKVAWLGIKTKTELSCFRKFLCAFDWPACRRSCLTEYLCLKPKSDPFLCLFRQLADVSGHSFFSLSFLFSSPTFQHPVRVSPFARPLRLLSSSILFVFFVPLFSY